MTPEQALEIVDNTLAGVTANRQQHLLLLQAVGVLKNALEAVEPDDKAD